MPDYPFTPSRIVVGGIATFLAGILLAAGGDFYEVFTALYPQLVNNESLPPRLLDIGTGCEWQDSWVNTPLDTLAPLRAEMGDESRL